MEERSPVHIFCALDLEARAVLRGLRKPGDAGAGRRVEVHVIGIGAKRMPQINTARPCVIVAGLAGALDPALHVGDLVLDSPLPPPSAESPGGFSGEWSQRFPVELPWRFGAIHSAGHLIATPAEKTALFRETGALAVDMEQAAVRRALPTGAIVIGLRAISDPAHMALDPAILGFVDEQGRPRPLRVASALLRRPSLLPQLLALRKNTALALKNLGAGIRAAVDGFPRGADVAYAPPRATGTVSPPGRPSL